MEDRRRVAVVEGDGIGAEVVQAAKTVAEAAGARVRWIDAPAGERAHASVGDRLPRETIALIKECGVALKGPLINPVVGDASPNIALRVELGLFANVRLAHTLDGIPAVFPGTDLVVIREVTEDLFTGAQQWLGPDAAMAVKYVTRDATTRAATFAFDWARRNGRKKITIIHKATVLKTTDGLFLDASRAVAARFPDIECDDMLVDTVAMQLVRDPHRFDVLFAGFFYGDILADLVSGLVGGLGIAPGASFGDGIAIFEPVHGTVPRYVGKDTVDPVAMILCAALMLDWLGDAAAASRIRRAVEHVLLDVATRPRDLGGSAGTQTVTRAIAGAAAEAGR